MMVLTGISGRFGDRHSHDGIAVVGMRDRKSGSPVTPGRTRNNAPAVPP
jgi:hypothetical protein